MKILAWIYLFANIIGFYGLTRYLDSYGVSNRYAVENLDTVFHVGLFNFLYIFLVFGLYYIVSAMRCSAREVFLNDEDAPEIKFSAIKGRRKCLVIFSVYILLGVLFLLVTLNPDILPITPLVNDVNVLYQFISIVFLFVLPSLLSIGFSLIQQKSISKAGTLGKRVQLRAKTFNYSAAFSLFIYILVGQLLAMSLALVGFSYWAGFLGAAMAFVTYLASIAALTFFFASTLTTYSKYQRASKQVLEFEGIFLKDLGIASGSKKITFRHMNDVNDSSRFKKYLLFELIKPFKNLSFLALFFICIAAYFFSQAPVMMTSQALSYLGLGGDVKLVENLKLHEWAEERLTSERSGFSFDELAVLDYQLVKVVLRSKSSTLILAIQCDVEDEELKCASDKERGLLVELNADSILLRPFSVRG